MTLLISIYLTLIFLSKEFQNAEVWLISTLAAISAITYCIAVYVRPHYADLPENKSDEEFLNLLRRIIHHSNKKICAYCQIEKKEKARHCFICKRCVLEHDSHCFMLNNCVGKHNRRFVLTYIIFTMLLLLCITLSAFFHLT
mgnify:CR=1 FL=1